MARGLNYGGPVEYGGGLHTERATLDAVAVPDCANRLTVRVVHPEERARGRACGARHHYLGFRGLVGEALYYVACGDDR